MGAGGEDQVGRGLGCMKAEGPRKTRWGWAGGHGACAEKQVGAGPPLGARRRRELSGTTTAQAGRAIGCSCMT